MKSVIAWFGCFLLSCGSQNAAPADASAAPGDGEIASGDALPADAEPPVILDGGAWLHDGAYFCHIRPCQNHVYQCGDCQDNDGDGLTDDEDPDCMGPCQDNELGFYGAISGQNKADCKMDCYFDQDTGAGNDTCGWDHRCDWHDPNPEGDACVYSPEEAHVSDCGAAQATQTQQCLDVCGPLTPNGCDCFGCCAVPPPTDTVPAEGVYLASTDAQGQPTCMASNASDPSACKPCVIVAGCFNPCGRCQICIGKPTIPEDCYVTPEPGDAGSSVIVPDQCPDGEQPCGLPGEPPCPGGQYCITGCCQTVIW